MTRENYLEYKEHYRKTGEINPEIFYEYYKQHNTNELHNFEEDKFSHYFSRFFRYIQCQPALMGAAEIMSDRIFKFFDGQFYINKLTSKEGKLLKEY